MLCSLVPRLAALVLVLTAAVARADTSPPFDPHVAQLPAEVRLPRWESARLALARDLPVLAACLERSDLCPTARLQGWRRMMLRARGGGWGEALAAVNGYVNATPYHRDRDRHGVVDHWSGPLEFLAGGGDCEDYAIAKYASLRLLGFPIGALRIVVLEDRLRGLAHAVLAVREGSRVWILDNQSDVVQRVEALPHYEPYYAVNEAQRWLHRVPGRPAATTAAR